MFVPFTFSTNTLCVYATEKITLLNRNELKIILMHLGHGIDVTRC